MGPRLKSGVQNSYSRLWKGGEGQTAYLQAASTRVFYKSWVMTLRLEGNEVNSVECHLYLFSKIDNIRVSYRKKRLCTVLWNVWFHYAHTSACSKYGRPTPHQALEREEWRQQAEKENCFCLLCTWHPSDFRMCVDICVLWAWIYIYVLQQHTRKYILHWVKSIWERLL